MFINAKSATNAASGIRATVQVDRSCLGLPALVKRLADIQVINAWLDNSGGLACVFVTPPEVQATGVAASWPARQACPSLQQCQLLRRSCLQVSCIKAAMPKLREQVSSAAAARVCVVSSLPARL